MLQTEVLESWLHPERLFTSGMGENHRAALPSSIHHIPEIESM
jgi:hypothetical protein